MSIEIVTETSDSFEKKVLEQNATRLLVQALNQYRPEPWEHALVANMLKTLSYNYYEE